PERLVSAPRTGDLAVRGSHSHGAAVQAALMGNPLQALDLLTFLGATHGTVEQNDGNQSQTDNHQGPQRTFLNQLVCCVLVDMSGQGLKVKRPQNQGGR